MWRCHKLTLHRKVLPSYGCAVSWLDINIVLSGSTKTLSLLFLNPGVNINVFLFLQTCTRSSSGKTPLWAPLWGGLWQKMETAASMPEWPTVWRMIWRKAPHSSSKQTQWRRRELSCWPRWTHIPLWYIYEFCRALLSVYTFCSF